MKSCVIFACLIVYVNAHACLLFPSQRGEISADIFTKAGVDSCLRISNPPCGNIPDEKPRVTYTAGQNATSIIIQKNLDHFYGMSDPGTWEAFLWAGSATAGKTVGMFPDSPDFKTLEVRKMAINIPSDAQKGKAILQLIYTTNNPNAPQKFYQCADIMIA